MEKKKKAKRAGDSFERGPKERMPTVVPNKIPVVAIGASAGGIDAILQLLTALPVSTGAAYVVLLHLPADKKSFMPELLQERTGMKVVVAADGLTLEPDVVHVVPPDAVASVTGGQFVLGARGETVAVPHVIDDFFLALAAHYQNKAIGVVLSGTATDGTAGIQAIKAEGGITFAQDETAQF